MFIFIIILGVMVFSLYRNQKALERRYRAFMRGGSGKSLAENLQKRVDEMDKMKRMCHNLDKRMSYIEDSSFSSYHKLGIVKYDAFKEMGGKLSFAYAMLNEYNDGFIINSIHSKEGCYSYIKEVVKGDTYLALGEEEAQALNQALQTGLGDQKEDEI